MKSKFGFLLLFFMVFDSYGALHLKEEIKQIKESIEKERKSILDAEIKKRGVMGALYGINKNLTKLNADIDQLSKQVNSAKQTMTKQASLIAQLEYVRDQQKGQLSERLRALYKMGFKGYAQVLLSSRSSADLNRSVKFLKIIAEHDAQLLVSYKENILKLSSEQSKLKGQVKNYLSSKQKLEVDKAKYDDEKKSQDYLLSKIEEDRKLHLQALKELRDAGFQLDEQLKVLSEREPAAQEIFRTAFYEKQGHLKPPVMRSVLQKYGIMTNAKFETKIFHKGIFFAARQGDPVASLFDGKVIHAGWVNGFGETLIIDHGDHYYSLYAHNTELLKKVGDKVSTGEVISKSGDTGSLRGPGLYFEIRHFSETLDPNIWFDKKLTARL